MLLFIIFCFIAYCVGGELWEICRYGLILGFVWAVVSEIHKKRPAAKARKESRKADREARRARRELEAARKELAAAVASVSSAPSADDGEDEDEDTVPSAPRMGLIERWKDEQRRMDEETFCALDEDEDEEAETMEKNVFIEQIEDPKTRARAYEILAETDLFPGETFEPLPDDADEDEAFHGIDREKEAKRLRRVLEGLYNKRDKLAYMGVSKNTQRWRGLEYDIAAAERRLAFFEG